MEHPIFQRIANAPRPDFGEILSKSFELFKKVWVQGLVHILLTFVVTIPLIILVYAPLVPGIIESETSCGGEFNPFEMYPPGTIILYVLFFFLLLMVIQVIAYAINAHFFLVLKQEDMGTPLETGGYFVFLKQHFGKLFVLSLAALGIAILATLLCYLPLIYVSVPLQLLAVIFAFNPNMSVLDIIKASFKLGHRYWLIIFGLIVVMGLIAQLGVLLCFVGVFVTASLVYLPIYYAYKDTVGFDDTGWQAPQDVV
jgi:hypothetical protein